MILEKNQFDNWLFISNDSISIFNDFVKQGKHLNFFTTQSKILLKFAEEIGTNDNSYSSKLKKSLNLSSKKFTYYDKNTYF